MEKKLFRTKEKGFLNVFKEVLGLRNSWSNKKGVDKRKKDYFGYKEFVNVIENPDINEEIHGVFNLQGIEVYYHIEIDTKAMKMKLLVAFLDQKGHQEILDRLFQTFLCLFKENVCQTALYI